MVKTGLFFQVNFPTKINKRWKSVLRMKKWASAWLHCTAAFLWILRAGRSMSPHLQNRFGENESIWCENLVLGSGGKARMSKNIGSSRITIFLSAKTKNINLIKHAVRKIHLKMFFVNMRKYCFEGFFLFCFLDFSH